MADTKKATTEAKTVRIKLRKHPDPRMPQDDFYSHNFQNYMIKRGEFTEVPVALANLIEENEEAEEYAMNYADEHKMRTPNV